MIELFQSFFYYILIPADQYFFLSSLITVDQVNQVKSREQFLAP